MENATMAEVLRENGWNTFWVGKNHNVPVDEWAMGATKRNWPLARGFDRFYGFIGGETNQWYPNLVEDNHYVDQPYLPEDGYHLSVIAAGALYGILAAVLISVLTLLFQLSRRPLEIVETVPAPDAEQISIPAGMLLVRPRSDIFFANVQHFRRDLYAALAARDPKPTILLVDGSRRYLFEFTANQTLREIVADLRKQGLEIWIVLPPGDAGNAVRRFRQVFGPGDAEFFPRVSDAVAAHLDELEGRD